MGAVLLPVSPAAAGDLEPDPTVTADCDSFSLGDTGVISDRHNIADETNSETLTLRASDGAGTVLFENTVDFPHNTYPLPNHNQAYSVSPGYNPITVEFTSLAGNGLEEQEILSETVTADCEALPVHEGPCDENYFPAQNMWEISWGRQFDEPGAALFTMNSYGGLTSLNGGAVPEYMTDHGNWQWLYPTRSHVVNGLSATYEFADNVGVTAVVSADENDCPFVEWTMSNVPGQPGIGEATSGNAEATIAFTAPEDDGGGIDSYTATCDNAEDAVDPISADGTESPITVTGLTNDAEYDCTVTATNFRGTSAPSAAVSVTPAAVAPAAPTDVAAAPGVASASVSFEAPVDGGTDPITGYEATCSAEGETTRTNTAAASPVVVSQLTGDVEYSCTVTATSDAGTSPASAAALVTPVTPAAPDAPTSVVAAGGDEAIALVYAAPSDPGTSPISHYQAMCKAPPSLLMPAPARSANSDGDQLAIIVTGLRNDVTYTCSVRAFNEVGSSPLSPEVTARTKAPDHQFGDVPEGTYYDVPVAWLAAGGITTGVGGTNKFAPARPVIRAEMAAFLYRLAGSPPASRNSGFSDVPTISYYAQPVTWLRQNGITTGIGGTNKFAPNREVTRAEMAAFLYRLAGSPAVSGNSGFTDVPGNTYYAKAVTWLRQNDITTGVGGSNQFAPNRSVTRAEMAAFLYRLGTGTG